ncbi:MAG: YafY family transcriptional regulator [Firmicutes bacterium HGW-Firmicutes-1]|jgi:predicted DNA-binding transcriptional regulator YafY|nr:MAG: YafY family transcriptional regulator [Firmicutes bacterium HGW-Firmicutes-1]
MKINRLLEITILLMNKGSITAKELANRFEVSTRTIYRDIDVLSLSGVPVYANKGKGGGISLLDSFTLNKTVISEQESDSILLALKTLEATRYPDVELILDKISSVFKKTNATDWVHIDFSPWGSRPNEYNKFQEIKRAILEHKVVSCDYVNSEGDKSQRFIEPMKLLFKGQGWYLWGYCKNKCDFRMFRISRVKNVIVTEEFYERRQEQAIDYQEFTDPMMVLIPLILRFQPQALYRIYDDFDDELITRNADGTCDVHVAFPEDDWIYGYLLSYGSMLEVLEPETIRLEVKYRIENSLKNYQ